MKFDVTKFSFINAEGYEDKGHIPGLLRAYRVEFSKNGEKEFNSCVFVPGTFEQFYQDQLDAWGDMGYEPFEMEHRNGWTETGLVIFQGYHEEYHELWEGKWEEFVREVDPTPYLSQPSEEEPSEEEPEGFWEVFEEELAKLEGPEAEIQSEAYRLATLRFKQDLTKTCTGCGCKTQWEHPSVPGMYMQSSAYEPNSDLCHDCLIEHCCSTNCLECKLGNYPNCPHLDLKKNYMEKEA